MVAPVTIRYLDPPVVWRLDRVTKLGDGDTFEAVLRRDLDEDVIEVGPGRRIIEDREEELEARVRLAYVDTPERGEAGYKLAGADLAFWLGANTGAAVLVRGYLWDTFGRLVADVYLEGDPETASQYLMSAGNNGAGWPAWSA